jgi:hypothetical protein
MTYLQEVGVELLTSHTVRQIIRDQAEIANVYQPTSSRRINADLIVMATARTSETEIYRLLRDRQVSVEAIGCVLAPRTVYEATLEGHRAARKLSDARLRWAAAPARVLPPGGIRNDTAYSAKSCALLSFQIPAALRRLTPRLLCSLPTVPPPAPSTFSTTRRRTGMRKRFTCRNRQSFYLFRRQSPTVFLRVDLSTASLETTPACPASLCCLRTAAFWSCSEAKTRQR